MVEVPFVDATNLFSKTFKKLNEMFLLESRENTVLNVIGIDIPHGLAYDIQFWVRTITFLFIGVGFINLFKNHKKLNFEFEYVILSITSILLLIVMVALPFISFGYGITRLFLQSLIILAPLFVLGGNICISTLLSIFPSKLVFNKSPVILSVLVVVLLLQNVCATTLIFSLFGIPASEDLTTEGSYRESLYIYETEVNSAIWLAKKSDPYVEKLTDKPGYQRIYLGYEFANEYTIVPPKIDYYFFMRISPLSRGIFTCGELT